MKCTCDVLSCLVVSDSLQSCGLSLPGSSAHGIFQENSFQQKYWSGLPFPIPGESSHAGVKSASFVSPALTGKFFITVPLGKPMKCTE